MTKDFPKGWPAMVAGYDSGQRTNLLREVNLERELLLSPAVGLQRTEAGQNVPMVDRFRLLRLQAPAPPGNRRAVAGQRLVPIPLGIFRLRHRRVDRCLPRLGLRLRDVVVAGEAADRFKETFKPTAGEAD